ncbi:unnamed protein product, partial [Phaeothamnion confervicola]
MRSSASRGPSDSRYVQPTSGAQLSKMMSSNDEASAKKRGLKDCSGTYREPLRRTSCRETDQESPRREVVEGTSPEPLARVARDPSDRSAANYIALIKERYPEPSTVPKHFSEGVQCWLHNRISTLQMMDFVRWLFRD